MPSLTSAAHTTGPPPGTPVPPAIPASSVQVKSLPAEMSHLAGLDAAAVPSAAASVPDPSAAPQLSDAAQEDLIGVLDDDIAGEKPGLGAEAEDAAAADEEAVYRGRRGEADDAPFLEITFKTDEFALVDLKSRARRFLPDKQGNRTVRVRRVNKGYLLDQPLDTMFQLLRTSKFLGGFLQDDTELRLDFLGLGLQLTEDNVFAKDTTLRDLQTFVTYLFFGKSLQIRVTEGPRFINRFNYLSAELNGNDEIDEPSPDPDDILSDGLLLGDADNPTTYEEDPELHDDEDEYEDDFGDDYEDDYEDEDGKEGALEDDGAHGGSPPSDAQEHDAPAQTEVDELDAGAGSTVGQQEQDEQAANEQAFREDYAGFDPDDHTRLAMPDPINAQQKRAASAALDGEAVDNPADAHGSPKRSRHE